MGECSVHCFTLKRKTTTKPQTKSHFLLFSFTTRMKFGFVTFKTAKDAYKTIDVSASDPALSVYDISFGGRRAFCKESYLDLGKQKIIGNWI